MEENKQEVKEKDGSTLGTIFGFIFLGMLVVGFLFMGKFNEFVNEKFPTLGHTVGIDRDDTANVVQENLSVTVLGRYVRNAKTETGENDTLSLVLREDKTFAFDDTADLCYNPLVGTYEIVGDNIIKLSGKTYYGCDSCFYKNGANIRNITVRFDKNRIIIDAEYNKTEESEELKNIKRYILNPVNGTMSDGFNETLINCE